MNGFDFGICIEPLLDWFHRNARVLPWRENPDAYRVWVSEIMLQQTRVEAVKPYYERFLRKLPDVEALAECPQDQLLKLWEGLGYYNRVRHMQQAARIIMRDYGGVVPKEYEQLLALPGIGHYTAGAIASIAYGKPYPAVDGNVLRVLMRLTGDDSDIAKQSVRKATEEWLSGWMKKSVTGMHPGIFNQALMELGALVCLPNGEPRCEACPWRAYCIARAQGCTADLPVKSKAAKRRIEKRTVLLLHKGDRIAISKRADKGLLAGMYEFPNCEGHLTADEAAAYVRQMGYYPQQIQELADAKHVFSHIEWHMIGYAVQIADDKTDVAGTMSAEAEPDQMMSAWLDEESWIFVDVQEVTDRYAIPAAFARYTAYLDMARSLPSTTLL